MSPLTQRTHGKVSRAKRNGTLIEMPCVQCGAVPTHAHHDDYSRPVDVIWLCAKHHRIRHGELGWGISLSTTKKQRSDFAKLLKDWRATRMRFTRADAARRLGVPYRTLEDWEAAKRTPRGMARQLLIAELTKSVPDLPRRTLKARPAAGSE